MKRVHAVGVDEAGKVGGAADAADDHDFVLGNLQIDQSLLHGGEHAEVAAAGAPVGIDSALEICHYQLLGSRYICRHSPWIFLRVQARVLDHDFVRWDGKCVASELFFYRFHDVVRHERLSVVFANVSIGHEAGLTSQVAGELPTEVVFHDDGVACILQDVDDCVAMQRHQPANLQLIGGDSLLAQDLAGLLQ